MEIGQMTLQDWREFETHFPGAMAFLRHRTLKRELEYLRERRDAWGIKLNDWQEKRLTELEALGKEWENAGNGN